LIVKLVTGKIRNALDKPSQGTVKTQDLVAALFFKDAKITG